MIYVMSDIHGHRARFDSVMGKIALQPTDTLYVLGDVIDRSPDGIPILRQLMAMPNVRMLLGNHEYMMLQALDDFENSHNDGRFLRIWYRNGGEITHRYLKRIRKTLRREIFDYLRALSAEMDIEVGGARYKLVHGAPLGYRYEQNREKFSSPLACAVWSRWSAYERAPSDHTLIFGHTPTYRYQKDVPLAIFRGEGCIGIDCGCGLITTPNGLEDGRLACLRLDDMAVFYSDF